MLLCYDAISMNLTNNYIQIMRRGQKDKDRELNQEVGKLPWLFPIARVRKEHIMPRPSVMLRSNKRVG